MNGVKTYLDLPIYAGRTTSKINDLAALAPGDRPRVVVFAEMPGMGAKSEGTPAAEIAPGASVPPPDSPAIEGRSGASMVLFRVKNVSATDNLPLILEIPNGTRVPSRIALDV